MSVKKRNTKRKPVNSIDNSESKEEKVAKNNAKYALITGVLIALIGSPILLEIVKKKNEPQPKRDEREIVYYETALAESNDQIKNNEIANIKAKARLDVLISNEKDEHKKQIYIRIKDNIENAIESMHFTQKSFNNYSVSSIEAEKAGDGFTGAILRRQANEIIAPENKRIEKLNEGTFIKEIVRQEIKSEDEFVPTTIRTAMMSQEEFIKLYGKDALDYRRDIDVENNISYRLEKEEFLKKQSLIRGINKTEQNKSKQRINETSAKNETVETQNNTFVAAVAP